MGKGKTSNSVRCWSTLSLNTLVYQRKSNDKSSIAVLKLRHTLNEGYVHFNSVDELIKRCTWVLHMYLESLFTT